MALIENKTQHYYKINFERCKIQGLQVFVNYSVYESQQERQREKLRERQWTEFFRELRADTEKRHGELLTEIEVAGLEPTEILDASEGLIDRTKHPQLRELQDSVEELHLLERQIGDGLFRMGELPPCCLEVNDGTRERLTRLGFDEAWLLEPVRIISGGEVNTGEYKGEEITPEFYYNRLKTVLGDITDTREDAA